jgi:hypothetical protein
VRPRWPFARAIAATLVMHSGDTIRFTCEKLTFDVNEMGAITGYSWAEARGAPLFIDHTRIESARTEKTWRWNW